MKLEATIRFEGNITSCRERHQIPREGLAILGETIVGARVFVDGSDVGELVKPLTFDTELIRTSGGEFYGTVSHGGELDVILDLPLGV